MYIVTILQVTDNAFSHRPSVIHMLSERYVYNGNNKLIPR